MFPNRPNCLNAVEIFCDLSRDEVDAISRRAPVRQVEAGALIYSPEQPNQVLFMVNEGRVQTYYLTPDGRMLTTGLLGPGALFGEMALVGQTLHGSFAHAVTRSLLCAMNVEDVRRILLADVRISNRILEMVGKRLLETQRHLSILTHKHMPHRVAALLLQMSDMSAEIHCTHEALASMVGANRETVTKILSDLRRQQLIELRRGRIILLDRQRLAETTTL